MYTQLKPVKLLVKFVDDFTFIALEILMDQFYYELLGPRNLVKKEILIRDLADKSIQAETVYSLVSPGTEIAAWKGLPPLRPSKQYPRLIGYCNIARVTKIQHTNLDLKPGDYILTHQSHRSCFSVNDEDIICSFRDVSDNDLKRLTATYIFHLGYMALLNGSYFPGDRVAIVAYGAIGYATAQLVKAFGGEPYIFSDHLNSSDAFMHVCKKSDEALSDGLESCFDIVINNSNSWDDHILSLKLSRVKGCVVMNGFPGREGDLAGENPLASKFFYDKQLTLKHSGFVFEGDISPADIRYNLKRNMEYLSQLVLLSKVEVDKLICSVYDRSQLDHLYKDLEHREIQNYSGVLKWG